MGSGNEALVVLCKCGESHKTFGIRAETDYSNHWLFTWAFPIKETTAKREGYDRVTIHGQIEFDDGFPGCPYCGQKSFTVCDCGHLNCTIVRGNVFTCEWCGTKGVVGDYTGQGIAAGIDL